MSSYYTIFKNFLILFGFLFLINELYINFNKIFSHENKNYILLILIIKIILLNLISLRNFQFLKICTSYKNSLSEWSKIFFESLIINLTFNHVGTAYRAIELKKRGVELRDFVSIFYTTLAFFLIVNFFLISLELLIFCNFNVKNKIIILLFVIFSGLSLFLFPKIIENIMYFFRRFKNNFMHKIFTNIFFIFNTILKFFFLRKIIILLTFYSLLLHFIELIFFYFVYTIFYKNTGSLNIFFLLFTVNFILDRIPYVHQIPGIVETIFALISIPLGLSFSNSFILKLIIRFSDIISSLITYIFFSVIMFGKKKMYLLKFGNNNFYF